MALPRGLISIICLLLAACGHADSGSQTSAARGCSGDIDCAADQLCVFGLCNTTCSEISDCSGGAVCLDTGRGSACVRLQDNACVSTSNCPARTRCIAGRCLQDCEAGSGTQCPAGESCMAGVCGPGPDGGTGLSLSTAGRGAYTSSAGVGSAGTAALGPCELGSVRCDGQWVMRCGANGEEVPEETCPFACYEGACTGSCPPMLPRCKGRERQLCDETGTWQVTETCASVCTAAACEGTCVEGALECSGTTITRCVSGKLVEQTTCPFTCEAGACGGACMPGARRCTAGSASVCGSDGSWLPAVLCANACTDGQCSGVCTPGTQRCAGSSAYQTCSDFGQWGGSESCGGKACFLGGCIGVCTPGEQRCTDALSVQTCELNGEWAAASTTCVDQACSQGKCVSSAPPTTTCQMGQSPDWWSSEADGGNTSLDDPRWGAAPIVPFESTFGFNPGGYIVLLDRAAGRLSVSIRVTMGPAELPAPDDYIYFGATPNVADAPAARSVTVPLRAMMAGDDATPISTFQSSVYTTTWQSGNKADWAQNIAAWRGGPDDGFSWAVNLVVDLTRVGIDVSKPFRVALAIHAEGSTQDLTVPANTGGLILTPSGWAAATITASGCVERVALQ